MSYETLKAEAIGWWELQETGGSIAADDSTAANDATIYGTLATTTGPTAWLPTALDANSANLFVAPGAPATSFPSGADARTICAWANPAGGTYQNLFRGSAGTFPIDGGALIVALNPSTTSGLISFQGNNRAGSYTPSGTGWEHVSLVVPSGADTTDDVQLWINGTQVTLSNAYGSPQTLNTDLGYGATGLSGPGFGGGGILDPPSYFVGAFAGACTFQRALSPLEIAELIAGPSGSGGSVAVERRRRRLGLGSMLGVRR